VRDKATGKLVSSGERTEVCQYYAFFFKLATPQTHPELWKRLCGDFGPQRKQTKAFSEIHFANAFIGNYLRLAIFSEYQNKKQILNEVVGYFLKMADTTGTLWENDGTYASCNHCFASYVTHWLLSEIVGIRQISQREKSIQLQEGSDLVDWASGKLPIPGGVLSVNWHKQGQRIHSDYSVPEGYRVIR